MSGSDCAISSIFRGDGSQYLKEANAPIYNVLAIPGLGHVNGSGGLWSSKSGNEEVSWLTDLLPTHAICAHVMMFTYPRKRLLEDVSPEDIRSMAIALLDQLEGLSNVPGNIAFVAHDFGGLILKQALSIAFTIVKYHDLAARTSLLIFFATPHRTSSLTSWENIANWLLLITREDGSYNLAWISRMSRVLETISKNFEPIKQIYKTINIFCTSLGTTAGAATNSLMWQGLNSYSTTMGVPKELSIERDKTHSDLIKFSTDSDVAFIKIYEELRQSKGPGISYIQCLSSFSETFLHYDPTGQTPKTKGPCSVDSAILAQLESHESYRSWLKDSIRKLYIRGQLEIDIVGILSHIEDSKSRSVISFNCFAAGNHHYGPTQLLASLCHQILCLKPYLFKNVSNIYELYLKETTWTLNRLRLFFSSLIECPDQGHTVCLIQNLDELQDPKPILDDITTMATQEAAKFKFLVSTRSWHKGQDHFLHKHKAITIELSLQVFENAIDYAIKTLILNRPKLSAVAVEIKELSCQKYWGSTHMNTFSESSMIKLFHAWLELLVNRSNPTTKLSLKQSADALPNSVFEIYHELLNNIPDQSRQMLQNVIHWLAHSYRPLKLSELAIVAIFDQKSKDLDRLGDSIPIDIGWDLHNALGNLIRIEGDHTVHIDDLFRRFILEKASPAESKMRSYGYQDHSAIAYMCLKYISLFVHDGAIQSSNSDFGSDLLLYAIRYWPEHYKRGKIDLELDSNTKLSTPEDFMPLLNNYSLIQAWARQYVECKTQRIRPESDHPLCVSVDVGCHDLVNILLNTSHHPKVLTISLESSIRRGEESLARLLIKSKATTTNALHIAAAFGQENMLSLCYDITASLIEENEGGFAAIHCACEGGYFGIVEKLLNHGVNAELESSVTGQSPLHIACQFGHVKIIEHLLGKGVDPIKKDISGLTPLHTAIKWQQIGSVRALFEKQSFQQFNMLATDKNGYTALHFATESSRLDVINILLATLKDISTNGDENLRNQLGEAISKNSTPLHIAASTKNSEIVKALLLWAANQGHIAATLRVDAEGCIPLHLAAISGCPEIVKQLLQEHLKPKDQLIQRARNLQNAYPIHLAIKKHRYAVVKILLEAHSQYDVALDLFFKLAVTPLHMASTYGQLDIVKLLLNYNATANVVDWYDKTPLFYASERGHLRIVQELLDYEADPNAADEKHTSPLLSATRWNHIHVVELLLSRGADPNHQDKWGDAPVLAASKVGHAHIVNLLLKRGADPNIRDDLGFSPLLIAAKNGHVEVVKLLFQNDITDLEAIGPDQKTILHFAADNDKHNTIEYILSHCKINPNVADLNGNTPLHFIAQKGLVDMAFQFLDHGASPTAMNKIGQAPVHLAQTEELMLMLLPSADDLKDQKFDNVLHRATELGYLKLLKKIQEERGSLKALDNKGCCLYHTAARIGRLDVIKLLIQFEVPGIDLEDDTGRTPISHAAECGNLDIVRIVAEKAPKTVRSPDMLKRTPLFHAAGNDQLNVVTYLLQDIESSRDIDSTDSQGQTPLWLAASRGYALTAQSLVLQGADTTIANREDGWTPLHCAAQLDKREVVKLLSGNKKLRDIQDKEGRTALFLGAYAGNKEVVKELLGKGAADLSDTRGWITLHAAYDNPAILKILLERPDVDVNAKANGGETALHLACASNRDSVNLLVQRGADPLQKDSENVTPLHITATYSYEDSAIQLLLNNIREPLNIKDNNLQTPLMLAIKGSNTSAVEWLLKAQGLELSVSGEEEEDAIISMAVAQSNRKVVELILEHGRSILSTASIEALLIWAIKEKADTLSRPAIEILSERAQELTRRQELIELVWENDNIPLANFLLKFRSSTDIRDSHNWVLEQIISAFQPPIEEGKTVLRADSQHLSPSRWDPVRTSQGLELLDPEAHYICYKYQRWSRKRFLTALADHPIPLSSKFYFEIEIINYYTDDLGIGFGHNIYLEDRMPGWDKNSWGWHGDDGALYHGNGYPLKQNDSWKYSTGDIIGCCIDTSKGTASFTKNGKPLEVGFQNISGRVFPIIALGRRATAKCNFGGGNTLTPFKFHMENVNAKSYI